MTCRSSAPWAFRSIPVSLKEHEAVEIARAVAIRHGWPWLGPPRVTFMRLIDRRPEWRVQAGRVYVIIDDVSGYPFIKRLGPVPKWKRRRRVLR